MNTRRRYLEELLAALPLAVAGRAACAAILSLALHLSSVPLAAFAIHAIAVPMVFGFVALMYFRREEPLPPLATALFFAALTFGLDLAVEILFQRRFDVRSQLLATWLPAHLALVTTWISGLAMSDHHERSAPQSIPEDADAV